MIFHNTKAAHDAILAARADMAIARSSVAQIFTDGGCEPNPGHGGFAVVMHIPGVEVIELIGGAPATTNNRMEMTAVLMAIRALPQGITGVIHSDSQYVVKGITIWMHGWARAGWVRKPGRFGAGGEIQNLDLWQALWRESKNRSLSYQWVRGHAGHEHNERADELASLGRQSVIDGEIAPVAAIEADPPRGKVASQSQLSL